MSFFLALIAAAALQNCDAVAEGPTYEPIPYVSPAKGPVPPALVATARKIAALAQSRQIEALDRYIDDSLAEGADDAFPDLKRQPTRAERKVTRMFLVGDDMWTDTEFADQIRAGLGDLSENLPRAKWGRPAGGDAWCTYDDPEPDSKKLSNLATFAHPLPFAPMATGKDPVPVRAGLTASSPVIATLAPSTIYLFDNDFNEYSKIATVYLPQGRLGFVLQTNLIASTRGSGPTGYCFAADQGGRWRIVSVAAIAGG